MVRFALAAALVLCSSGALADLAKGREKLLHGDYQDAIDTLEATSGKERFDAQLLKVEAHLRIGEHDRAERLARKLATASGERGERGQLALARLLMETGDHDEARRLLEGLVAKNPKPMGPRYHLAMLYRAIGETEKSSNLFAAIYDDYRNRSLDEKDPHQLFYLAEAGRHRGSYEFANGFYSDAVNLDPSFHRANAEWGYLLLQKFNVADAERSFDEILKIDPNHPDAHAGLARVKLEQSYDLAAATMHLERALAVNPKHIPALHIRAELEIDKNQWPRAEATIASILKINPKNLYARAQLATIYWLRDDGPRYEAEKARILAQNPAYGELFHVIARSAVREHRYQEAIALEHEALKTDPSYYLATAEIGTGYLRLGDEKQGLEWLTRAYDKDPYNVRTVNLLDLFEKVIPRDYVIATSKSFKLRLHKAEKTMYERYVVPTLETAFADMAARYKFTPKTPVVIELYQDPDHYSVRTVGLPNLGALGVCFGQVITARSPSVGDMNWGMVLWHELAHVFAIQVSKSRVPRWYTEGLSEYETLIARPEWRRENDADLYSAMQAGTLPSVAELNYGFMKPDMQEVVVAYYLSAVTIEYIAETYGFDRIVQGLELFGTGLETPEVISKITGKSVPDFDREFRTYLEARLSPYKGTFRLPSSGYGNVETLQKAAEKSPKSAQAWADLALGYYFDGNAKGAQASVDKALALDPKHALAGYVGAELALRARDLARARELFEGLIRSGVDGAEIRGRLGMIASHEKKTEEAAKQLCAAKALDPERSYPYQALADLYFDAGKDDEGLAELETYVHLEQMQYTPVKTLVDEFYKRKAWGKVVRYGELGLSINLGDSDLLLKLAHAYREAGRPERSLFTYDSALLTTPPLRRPAIAHTGRAAALAALGRKREAITAVRAALKLEPTYAEALAVERTLK